MTGQYESASSEEQGVRRGVRRIRQDLSIGTPDQLLVERMGNDETEKLLLPVPHPSRLVSALLVIETHYMEQAVDDEGEDPLVIRDGKPVGLLPGPLQ